jgi:predicted phosphoribosyltransferase
MTYRFRDRTEAGRLLRDRLTRYANDPDTLVLALPRGGVSVAFEIARDLNLPLDVCITRKLGVPGRKELAMGAIGRGGIRVINESIIEDLHLSEEAIDRVAREEEIELERREHLYRGDRPFPEIAGKTVILVDDGIATGATLKAAILTLKSRDPRSLVVAVPVGHPEICEQLEEYVDRLICISKPESLNSISLWYDDFSQTSDEEVRDLLGEANRAAIAFRS